jgi:hypothetical protein
MRDISIGIARGYGLDGFGSIPGSVRFSPFSQLPVRLWGSPTLLSSGYRVLSGRGVKLTTHFHLVPRPRKVVLFLHYHRYHHGIVLK